MLRRKRKNRQEPMLKMQVPFEELAKKYGTPLYVYDADAIKERFSTLKKAIQYKYTSISYSCKANSNPHILRLMKSLGVAGIDTVSRGEIDLALEAGFTPESISITNPGLSMDDMKYCEDKGVTVKADSISQLKKWRKIHTRPCWLRVNPGTRLDLHAHLDTGSPDSKFGIYPNEIREAKEIAKDVIGLHQHAGSGSLDANAFVSSLEPLYAKAKLFKGLKALNIGGGIGVAYGEDEKPMNLPELGEKLTASFEEFCGSYGEELELRMEPGRFLVAESGYLLTEVKAVKKSPNRKYAIVDTGFNHFLRPILYDAYHKVLNITGTGLKEETWIAGNVCEAGDILAKSRKITNVREGDLLAFCDAGAYGYAMASNYLSFPKPAEVMVKDGKAVLIRERE